MKTPLLLAALAAWPVLGSCTTEQSSPPATTPAAGTVTAQLVLGKEP